MCVCADVVLHGGHHFGKQPTTAYMLGGNVSGFPAMCLLLSSDRYFIPLQEYQDNKPDLAITETNPKQTVYVFKCTKSTLKVAGKVNSIILGKTGSHPIFMLC